MERRPDKKDYATDMPPTYLKNYARHFACLADQNIRLLVLGVHKGGSLLMWRDYFANGLITGLDSSPGQISEAGDRVFVYQGSQEDRAILDKIAQERAPGGFDVIIDSYSHLGEPTKISFWHLFDNHLKSGGIYVIEDWRLGYWEEWPDGKNYQPRSNRRSTMAVAFDTVFRRKRKFPSHSYGMVGLVKELVDELGMDMITFKGRGFDGPQRYPRFSAMEITPGQVFITKATGPDTELIRAGLRT